MTEPDQISRNHLPSTSQSEIKATLYKSAKKEGRNLAQVCELFLRDGVHEYEKQAVGRTKLLLARSAAAPIE